MKIGVFSTFMSPLATPQMIHDFGRRAEDIGLDSIWMGEHVALFDKNTFGYPGAKDGRIPVPPGGGMLDVVATFGFLAAATSRLRLGTGVALVPQRNPFADEDGKDIRVLDVVDDTYNKMFSEAPRKVMFSPLHGSLRHSWRGFAVRVPYRTVMLEPGPCAIEIDWEEDCQISVNRNELSFGSHAELAFDEVVYAGAHSFWTSARSIGVPASRRSTGPSLEGYEEAPHHPKYSRFIGRICQEGGETPRTYSE
jgi:hypothetical protein